MPEIHADPERYKVVFVDNTSEVSQQAHDIARAKMTEDREKLKGPVGFLKRVIKHNWLKEYNDTKELYKAKKRIEDSGNMYVDNEGANQAMHDRAVADIVEQFTADYDEAIHHEAGESKKSLDATITDPAVRTQTNSEIRQLIADYANGVIPDEATFKAERVRRLSAIKGVPASVAGGKIEYVDNLFKVATDIRNAANHEEALNRLDISVGVAKGGVRNEAEVNKFSALAEKLHGRSVTKFFKNEAALAAGLSLAYTTTVGIGSRLVKSRLSAIATFGASALVVSYVAKRREEKMLTQDLQQQDREEAQNQEWDADPKKAPRRHELAKHTGEKRGANELHGELNGRFEAYKTSGSLADLQTTLASLAEIEGRTMISDSKQGKGKNLIRYSDRGPEVRAERLQLDKLRAEVKKEMKARQAAGDTVVLNLCGGNASPDAVNRVVDAMVSARSGQLETAEKGRDKSFNDMKKSKGWKKFRRTLAITLILGGIAQEGWALLDSGQEGLVEHMVTSHAPVGPGGHHTMADSIYHLFKKDGPSSSAGPDVSTFDIHNISGTGGHVKLPPGYDLQPSTDGDGFSILHDGHALQEHVHFNSDGSLTDESVAKLMHNGIGVRPGPRIATPDSAHHATGSSGDVMDDEYIKAHPGMFHEVETRHHMNNDTKVFDKNEQKLWWGGDPKTPGVRGDNYEFDANHMKVSGSYHGGHHVDAQQLIKEGKLKILFSMSKGTQKNVAWVDVDTHGHALIPKNSEMGKLFFETDKNGHAVFKGKFAEAATEYAPKKFDVLATHTGHGFDKVPGGGGGDDVVTLTKGGAETILIPLGADNPNVLTDIPPVIPFTGRYPLERTKRRGGEVATPPTEPITPPPGGGVGLIHPAEAPVAAVTPGLPAGGEAVHVIGPHLTTEARARVLAEVVVTPVPLAEFAAPEAPPVMAPGEPVVRVVDIPEEEVTRTVDGLEVELHERAATAADTGEVYAMVAELNASAGEPIAEAVAVSLAPGHEVYTISLTARALELVPVRLAQQAQAKVHQRYVTEVVAAGAAATAEVPPAAAAPDAMTEDERRDAIDEAKQLSLPAYVQGLYDRTNALVTAGLIELNAPETVAAMGPVKVAADLLVADPAFVEAHPREVIAAVRALEAFLTAREAVVPGTETPEQARRRAAEALINEKFRDLAEHEPRPTLDISGLTAQQLEDYARNMQIVFEQIGQMRSVPWGGVEDNLKEIIITYSDVALPGGAGVVSTRPRTTGPGHALELTVGPHVITATEIEQIQDALIPQLKINEANGIIADASLEEFRQRIASTTVDTHTATSLREHMRLLDSAKNTTMTLALAREVIGHKRSIEHHLETAAGAVPAATVEAASPIIEDAKAKLEPTSITEIKRRAEAVKDMPTTDALKTQLAVAAGKVEIWRRLVENGKWKEGTKAGQLIAEDDAQRIITDYEAADSLIKAYETAAAAELTSEQGIEKLQTDFGIPEVSFDDSVGRGEGPRKEAVSHLKQVLEAANIPEADWADLGTIKLVRTGATFINRGEGISLALDNTVENNSEMLPQVLRQARNLRECEALPAYADYKHAHPDRAIDFAPMTSENWGLVLQKINKLDQILGGNASVIKAVDVRGDKFEFYRADGRVVLPLEFRNSDDVSLNRLAELVKTRLGGT